MILELKDKISLADTLGEQSAMVSAGAVDSKTNANRAEAIEALTALGFSASEAVKAVSGVKDIETLSTEAIIKAALKKNIVKNRGVRNCVCSVCCISGRITAKKRTEEQHGKKNYHDPA